MLARIASSTLPAWLTPLAIAMLVAVAACGAPAHDTRSARPAEPGRDTTGRAPSEKSADLSGAKDADDAEEGGVSNDPRGASPSEPAKRGPCPAEMALVDTGDVRICVDRYEASLVEVEGDGVEKPYPHYATVDGHAVRAVSKPGVFPQGFISEVQAQDACAASNKRLCSHAEWKVACKGPSRTTFPYGDTRRPGVCHDTGKSAVAAVFGAKALAASTPYSAPARSASPAEKASARKSTKTAKGTKSGKSSIKSTSTKAPSKNASKPRKGKPGAAQASSRPASVDPGVWAKLNEPKLGQVEGALAKTGDHDGCVNGWGLFDMVGNLHEWTATDAKLPHGTFAGGYYLDTSLNGDGCDYRTGAHAHDYHDYSTGFRCCAEPDDAD